MDNQYSLNKIENIDLISLSSRLAMKDWKKEAQFIPTEQIFKAFCDARAHRDKARISIFSRALSERILELSKGFVRRSGIYPAVIGSLDQAAEELAQFFWECLITRQKDEFHAQSYFGQIFKCRAIDFQRQLLAKKRASQQSLDAFEHTSNDDEDPDINARLIPALQDDTTPEGLLEIKQTHAQVTARLQTILTKEEHYVYVMLYVEEMPVKDIAHALGVTPRTINNYKNAALEKVKMEFTK